MMDLQDRDMRTGPPVHSMHPIGTKPGCISSDSTNCNTLPKCSNPHDRNRSIHHDYHRTKVLISGDVAE